MRSKWICGEVRAEAQQLDGVPAIVNPGAPLMLAALQAAPADGGEAGPLAQPRQQIDDDRALAQRLQAQLDAEEDQDGDDEDDGEDGEEEEEEEEEGAEELGQAAVNVQAL
jgi:hypothetical protein